MKTILAVVAVTFCLFVAVPASAHHAAEGIVSEEIYAMIEENLAGTPHLDMTLDDLGTMMVVQITVPVSLVDDVIASVAAVLQNIQPDVEAGENFSSGQGGPGSLSIELRYPDPDDPDGLVTIEIIENVGQYLSQVPAETP
jgi:hypothetical protein